MKILYKYTPLNVNSSEPWTHARYKKLQSRITKLSSKQLGHVCNIVKVYEQDPIKADEIDVNFQSLKTQTINELKSYVDSLKPWNDDRQKKLKDQFTSLPIMLQIEAYEMAAGKQDQTKNKSGSGFSFSGMSDSALDDLQNSVNILMAWNAGQRRELETEIRNLADEELGHVVNIVKIYESNEPYPKKFEIDLEKLKTSTLNELQDYVDNVDCEPWTRDQKLDLMIQVNNLNGRQLANIVCIIKTNENQGHDDPDEIEVDFEKLKTRTLNKIKNYVDNCDMNSIDSDESND